jgi:hypothetical protein
MKLPSSRLVGAALVPPLAMLPFFAVWMSVNAKRELDTWMPMPTAVLLIRVLLMMYVIVLVAHVVYGGVITLVARTVYLNHVGAWIAVYVGPAALYFLTDARSLLTLLDAMVNIALTGIVALVAWLYLRPFIVESK